MTANRSPSRARSTSVRLTFGPAGPRVAASSTCGRRTSGSATAVAPFVPDALRAGAFFGAADRGFVAAAPLPPGFFARELRFAVDLAPSRAADLAPSRAVDLAPSRAAPRARSFEAAFLVRRSLPPVLGSFGMQSSLEPRAAAGLASASSHAEQKPKCSIDLRELHVRQLTDPLAKTGVVERAELLDHHARALTPELDGRTKRRGADRGGSGRDDDRGERQEPGGLEHHAKPPATLLASARYPRRSQLVDITTYHRGSP